MAKKEYALAHTKWMCKYHIIFTPQVSQKNHLLQNKTRYHEIFRHLCQYKGAEIIEGHMMPDRFRMLVLLPPKLTLFDFTGYLINM